MKRQKDVKQKESYRQDNKKQEVAVCDIVELVEKILGDEAERRVFGCPNLVSFELGRRPPILVQSFRW